MAIVGDAFAKPMLRTLDENPAAGTSRASSRSCRPGVMWSKETKDGSCATPRHAARGRVLVVRGDRAWAARRAAAGAAADTAKFQLSPNTIVIDDADRRSCRAPARSAGWRSAAVNPSATTRTRRRSARTFLVIDGERYSCPGDFATVEADGTITLLGRGSVCINTGGEKVFPEEVEEALKTHPSVLDAVAVGVPDDRFGEAVTGGGRAATGRRRRCRRGHRPRQDHARRLQGARDGSWSSTPSAAPPNGKVDYKRLKSDAMASLGVAPS